LEVDRFPDWDSANSARDHLSFNLVESAWTRLEVGKV